jgi:4-methyl-5(b-hydroxyethyl)-thiazole monophosphate biosynthesis
MTKVLVPLANGFEEIEATTLIDVLRRGGIEVVTASIHDVLNVKGAHGIEMSADTRLADVFSEMFDAIVLPGGGEGTENLKNSEMVRDILRKHGQIGILLCAICAAPIVLVEAGVIAPNTHITCYPTCQMMLDRPWTPAPVVADGNIITGQAPGVSTLFALVVLKALAGDKIVSKVTREMVTDVLD